MSAVRAIGHGVLAGVFAGALLVRSGALSPRPRAMDRPMPDAEVLVLGDCEAWGWTYDGVASFPLLGDRVQDLGVPSYTVADLRRNVPRLRGATASLVVLQVGAADVGRRDSGQVAADVVEVVEEIYAEVPGIQVIVLPVLPRARPEAQAEVDTINAILAEDLWTIFARIEVPADLLGADGVHLRPEGYAVLARELAPWIAARRRPTSSASESDASADGDAWPGGPPGSASRR